MMKYETEYIYVYIHLYLSNLEYKMRLMIPALEAIVYGWMPEALAAILQRWCLKIKIFQLRPDLLLSG